MAPAPAPSVGVKKPLKIPPRTAKITKNIPAKLIRNCGIETSFVSSLFNCLSI